MAKGRPFKISTSFFTIDNTIWEEIIQEDKTYFITKGGIKVECLEQNPLKVYPRMDALIRKKVIRLPSDIEEYENEKELLSEIQKFIHKYVEVMPEFEKISAYYVLLTWLYDRFNTIGYLRVLGEWGTGKTRFRDVVGSICYKPMYVSGAISTSAVFHLIDQYRGTLLLDEGDFKESTEHAEIIKILNCGYSKGTPVLRAEKSEGTERWHPVPYDVYSPKIITSRQKFWDEALESRCLTEIMEIKVREDIPIDLPEKFEEEALHIRNKLLKYRLDRYFDITFQPVVIPYIEPRINQILNPFYSVIQDTKMREEIIDFGRQMHKRLIEDRGTLMQAWVATALVRLYSEQEIITMGEIAKEINEIYELEEGITARTVGSLAKKMNIKKKTIHGRICAKLDDRVIKTLRIRYGIEEEIRKETLDDVVQ
ncbi:MAG: hypothetical protein KKB37_17265 [Alphaproteobacteria bacterium]|nr:hypothetical protein [Alphaproteobacteria bacterium]